MNQQTLKLILFWTGIILLFANLSETLAVERYSVEPPAHQWIALQAYRNLATQHGATDPMVVEIGTYLPASESNAHYADTFAYSSNWATDKNAPYDSVTALIEGVCEEDKPETRSIHHFWNPDGNYNAGLPLCSSALQMAQNRYASAVSQYRAGNKAQAWYWLGRCIHLLCDMSVPAHVQLDDHLFGDSYESYAANHYREIRAENALEVPVRSYPRLTPAEFNAELTSIFYSLADYADQFDSDDVDGSLQTFGQGRYNASGSISSTVLAEVYQPNLMGRAITSSARLIDLFWRDNGVVLGEPLPADTNADRMLTLDEFNAYGDAWKYGQNWSTGPNPIPIDFVTAAGRILKQGGNYGFTPGSAPVNGATVR